MGLPEQLRTLRPRGGNAVGPNWPESQGSSQFSIGVPVRNKTRFVAIAHSRTAANRASSSSRVMFALLGMTVILARATRAEAEMWAETVLLAKTAGVQQNLGTVAPANDRRRHM